MAGVSGLVHEHPMAQTTDWWTPPWIFDALGLTFDLDVASPESGAVPWVPAKAFLTPADDGLTAPYVGRCWANPPYGRLTGPFLERMAEHGNGVALVFSRTDTKWFQDAAATADAMCFIRKRIRFVRPDGTAGGSSGCGSVLIAWGTDCAKAVKASGLGLVIRPGW